MERVSNGVGFEHQGMDLVEKLHGRAVVKEGMEWRERGVGGGGRFESSF